MDDLFTQMLVGECDSKNRTARVAREELRCLVENPGFWEGLYLSVGLARSVQRNIILLPRAVFDRTEYIPALPEQVQFDDPRAPKHLLVTPAGLVYKTLI